MKKLGLAILCLLLTGCGYNSSNLLRVQGKDVMVLGLEGFIHVQNASATIYRSMDCKTRSMKGQKIADRPNIIENGPSSNLSIGSAEQGLEFKDTGSSSVSTEYGSTTNTPGQ